MQELKRQSDDAVRGRPMKNGSPTGPLLFGLLVTLLTVVVYSWYVTVQLSGLRSVQQDLAGRNRKDSLQLLRIQNDLNTLALAMRDMLDGNEPYPLTAWRTQFQRVRADLANAMRLEEQFAPARTPEMRQYLADSLSQFWDAVDRTFAVAQQGEAGEAREQIRLSLQARQQSLSVAVARLLVENTESEEQSSGQINHIYDRVQRETYRFLLGALAAILFTGLYLIYANRKLFAQLSRLSSQRSDLAQKLLCGHESTLRHLSRELHDEFGQILMAIGTMASRMHKRSAQDPVFSADLAELCEITQDALAKVRGLSQGLHPVTLEDADLETTLDWYLPSLQRRTGMEIHFDKSETYFSLQNSARIHVFRILQEALSNAIRHSGSLCARVLLKYGAHGLVLEVEDSGTGIPPRTSHHGIGLVGMRERAELLGGKIDFLRPTSGGTLVRLQVPRAAVEEYGD
jgi:signal transduction histidine kinase